METFVWCLLTTRLFFSIIQRLINLLFLLLCIHLCTLKIICKFYILYSKKFDTEPCWHPKPPSNSLSFFIFIYKLLHDIRKAFSLHALWLLNLQMSSLISSTKQKCFTEQRLNLFEEIFLFFHLSRSPILFRLSTTCSEGYNMIFHTHSVLQKTVYLSNTVRRPIFVLPRTISHYGIETSIVGKTATFINLRLLQAWTNRSP